MSGPFGTPQSTTPMQKVWAEASAKYVVEQASKVRESAAKWGQSATAILAAAGLATIFKGRESLDALPEDARGPIIVAVLLTAVASAFALGFAAWATSGTVGWSWNDPESFRKAQSDAAQSAGNWLTASAWALVIAFASAFVAVALILTSPKAASSESTLVVGPDGVVGCGDLTVDDGVLFVDGETVPHPPVSFHTTSECPD